VSFVDEDGSTEEVVLDATAGEKVAQRGGGRGKRVVRNRWLGRSRCAAAL